MIYFFTAIIILDTAHNLSPMAMAWSRGDVRVIILRHWAQYILIPGVALAIPMAIAMTQSRPLVAAVVTIYFTWNIWHFASQNYGLLRLFQLRRGWSWRPDWPFCMAVTIVGMGIVPWLMGYSWTWRLINLAIFAIPHWVSEIFLTSWASTRWKIFAPLILAAGCVGLLWVTPRATGMPVVGVLWVCWRAGLGFVHFIYDGLLWRFRNPEVRATIGKNLFVSIPMNKSTSYVKVAASEQAGIRCSRTSRTEAAGHATTHAATPHTPDEYDGAIGTGNSRRGGLNEGDTGRISSTTGTPIAIGAVARSKRTGNNLCRARPRLASAQPLSDALSTSSANRVPVLDEIAVLRRGARSNTSSRLPLT